MAECDAELAAVLFSRQEKISKDDQPVREADAIRKRSVWSEDFNYHVIPLNRLSLYRALEALFI